MATPPVRPTSHARHRGVSELVTMHRAVLLLALFIGAYAARLFAIQDSYNLFIDEITYAEISNNLANGDGLTLYGAPFNLHPPAAFAWLAGVIKIFGLTGSVDQLVLALRPAIALFGAGTVVIGVQIARRCGARPLVVAFVAAVLALDPFVISFDSRVMLEAVAQFFVAATVLVVVTLRVGEHSAWPRRGLVLLGGLSAAAAFCTKETFGLVLGAFLLLAILVPRLAPRRAVSGVLGLGVLGYAAVTAVIWATSGFEPWWRSHTSGLSRLLGTEQNTGFNAATTKVSLVSRVAANLGQFGATYLLLGLGGLTVLIFLLRTKPWRARKTGSLDRPVDGARMIVAVWGLAACGYLVYATAFGSIEEQMYYIPLVPVVIVLAVVWSGLARRAAARVSWRRLLPKVLAVAAGLVIAAQAVVWVQVHTHNDNTYEQFLTWERANVADGSNVAVTEDIAQFTLTNVSIGKWTTLSAIRENNADYVLVESALVEQGYSKMTVPTLDYLKKNATVAFRAASRTDGELYLFDVRRLPAVGGP